MRTPKSLFGHKKWAIMKCGNHELQTFLCFLMIPHVFSLNIELRTEQGR